MHRMPPRSPAVTLLAGLVSIAAWAQPPPATLPTRISVPSPTRNVTAKYEVALEEGKIWVRLNPDWKAPGDADVPKRFVIAATPEWAPLDGTGVPVVDGVPTPVTEISFDDERAIAIAENGDLIRYEDGAWLRPWGLPIPVPGFLKPLQLPADVTTWAHSMRLEQVQYYEDFQGNQFNYGAAGCTSLYALRGDGSRIGLADPWFPPDFAREMCGPNRGTFVSVGLAASASTTLVIDRAGTVYTRFFDYDAIGGTPFFKYRYLPFEKQPLPGTDPRSEQQLHAVPEQPWVLQPRIPDVGQTRLTRHVAVLQNGKGNAARELRVLGRGPTGRTGYFFKQLNDPAWQFRPTDEPIAEADFIFNDPARAVRAPPRDRLYSGTMVSGGKRVPQVAYALAPDFNFHCSPGRLVLVLKNGRSLTLTLHLVDAWSLFESENPEDTPNAFKVHKVTVEIAEAARASTDPLVREVLDTWFPGTHLEPWRFALVANQKEWHLFPVGYPAPVGRKDFAVHLRTPGNDLRLFPYRERYQAWVGDPSRCVPREVFNRLLDERRALKDELAAAGALTGALPAGTLTADVFSVLTTTRWTVGLDLLESFEEHLPALATAMVKRAELKRDRSADDYVAVRAMLKSRLCPE